MLSILTTNLCQEIPERTHPSPPIYYCTVLNKPMAQPRPEYFDQSLQAGDIIIPKEKSLLDVTIDKITTKTSKHLLYGQRGKKGRDGRPKEKPWTPYCSIASWKTLGNLSRPVPCALRLAWRGFGKIRGVEFSIGTVTGWIAGVGVVKVGKVAAFGLGGGVLLLHFACECGYINVNWDKVREAASNSTYWVDIFIRFVKNNSCYSVGFLGGFFFGVAST